MPDGSIPPFHGRELRAIEHVANVLRDEDVLRGMQAFFQSHRMVWLPKPSRRGIQCAICEGPVDSPRYRYCSDDCAAEGDRRREAENSRAYRKRKREEAQKGIEAKITRITRRDAS
jgi:hypothetical protein